MIDAPFVILADGGDFGHMSGFGWGMMIFWGILGVALVGILVWALARSGSPPTSGASSQASRPSPSEILAERFARGEIDVEEYRSRRQALE